MYCENFLTRKVKQGFSILAWCLYDFANQSFALNIVSLYFVRWITIEKGVPEFFYSLCYGVSLFFVAIFAPILGAFSDTIQRRKPYLIWATFISITFTLLLGLTESVFWGLFCFAVANFGCQLAVVFYNALLIDIAPRNKIGFISGLGRMFGYCGAILGLYIVRPLVLERGYHSAFVPSGILFLIFSLPCIIFIKDKLRKKEKVSLFSFLKKENLFVAIKKLRDIFFESERFAGLINFLKASFFGLCVVNTVMLFMAVYATRVFGLDENQIINLVVFSSLFAIVGSLFCGYLSDKIGYKRTFTLVFMGWGLCLLLAAFIFEERFYWFIGPLVGISLGSTWVVSRALVVHLVAPDKIGEVFGLFNLVGYLSGIIGALFWGAILFFLSPLGDIAYRIALLSLFLFLIPCFVFIRRIK